MSMSIPPALPRRRFLTGAAALGATASLAAFATTPAHAAGRSAPEVFGCPSWDARPPSSPVSLVGDNPNKIVVHHTAFENTPETSKADAFRLAHEIQDLHMDGNNWADSGQHFTISRGGYILEGRHRSLERLQAGDDMVVGAHTVGENYTSIGIENDGTYMTVAPPKVLYDSLVTFCAYICSQYALEPTEIYGHRDFNTTECPGDVLYSKLPQLRVDVANKLKAMRRH